MMSAVRMEDPASSSNTTRTAVIGTFSSQVIAFALFGRVSRLSCAAEESAPSFSDSINQVSKQFPDIPDIFRFGPSTVKFRSVGVFCRQFLNQGAVLGPFTGRKLSVEEVITLKLKSYWEIHQDGKVQYCVDGSDPHYRNWMYFIQYARHQDEQNLMAIQHEERVYFRAVRDIQLGEELLVWYDKYQYDLYMGIPQGFKDSLSAEENSQDDEIEDDSENEEIEVEETDDEDDGLEQEAGRQQHSPFQHTNCQQNTSSPIPIHSSLPGISAVTPFTMYHHTPHPTQPPSIPGIPNVQWLKPHGIGNAPPVLSMPPNWPNFLPLSPTNIGKPSNLDMFERWADGTRWRCQICQRIFTSQGSLRAHARIHTGEKPYQCQFCKRVFTQASTLRSHERLHTGEKPYKCDHCGKAFTQSAGLRSHLKTHSMH